MIPKEARPPPSSKSEGPQRSNAILLTYSEETNIARALCTVHGLCPIVAVDSGSADAIEATCRRYTSHFQVSPYQNHASQSSLALAHTPVKSDWVLVLDADFEVSGKLRRREESVAAISADVNGIPVVHRYVFGDADIGFGGVEKYPMPLARPSMAAPDLSDLVDFRFVVNGTAPTWNATVREDNELDEDASFWIRKQDKYSLRLAVEDELRRRGAFQWGTGTRFFGNSDERVIWTRNIWLCVPIFLAPLSRLFASTYCPSWIPARPRRPFVPCAAGIPYTPGGRLEALATSQTETDIRAIAELLRRDAQCTQRNRTRRLGKSFARSSMMRTQLYK